MQKSNTFNNDTLFVVVMLLSFIVMKCRQKQYALGGEKIKHEKAISSYSTFESAIFEKRLKLKVT